MFWHVTSHKCHMTSLVTCHLIVNRVTRRSKPCQCSVQSTIRIGFENDSWIKFKLVHCLNFYGILNGEYGRLKGPKFKDCKINEHLFMRHVHVSCSGNCLTVSMTSIYAYIVYYMSKTKLNSHDLTLTQNRCTAYYMQVYYIHNNKGR